MNTNDQLTNFKNEIQAMFEKSFKELSQKNSMNRTILANLMDAANQQSNKINNLDVNIENLRKNLSSGGNASHEGHNNSNYPITTFQNPSQITTIKKQIQKQQQHVHNQFDKMMHRLVLIEEGITNSKKRMQNNIKANKQAQGGLNEVIKQLEKIQREERIPEYKGNRDDLQREIQQFQKILQQEDISKQVNRKALENYKDSLIEPLNNFQTKMNQHNLKNQQILKDKLRSFTQKIKTVQRRVQQAKNLMNSQLAKSQQQQKKIISQMNLMQNEMIKIRSNLQNADRQRKFQIQNNAASLDAMIQEMLIQAKRLEERVDLLRKGYGEQAQRIKNQNKKYL